MTVKLTKKEQYLIDFNKTVTRMANTRKKPFTVNDVVAKVGNPPQGRMALGAIMNAAATRAGLRAVGKVPSGIESRRNALVTAWAK